MCACVHVSVCVRERRRKGEWNWPKEEDLKVVAGDRRDG